MNKDENRDVRDIGVSDKVLSRSDMSQSFAYFVPGEVSDTVEHDSNVESFEWPLIVNCAGNIAADFPFTTDRRQGRNDYMLVYVNSGKLTFFDGERPIEVGVGGVVIMPAHVPQKYSNSADSKLSYFWLHFTGSEVTERLAEYSLETFPTVYQTVSGNHIHQRFQSLFDAFSKRDEYMTRELAALFDRLLITASRSIVRVGGRQGRLSRSVSYIGANYSKEIRIAELAAIEYLSVSRYNYLFREQFGIPPTKYILNIRMSSAKELLNSTDLSVKQIGIMCGYDDPHFFTKVFKRFFGVNPTECRKGFGD